MQQEEAAAAAANKAGSEVTQNQTIYINNLNEKVKLDGNITFFFFFLLVFLVVMGTVINYRGEEVAEGSVLSVRKDSGGVGV